MRSFSNIIKSAALASALLFGAVFSANAVIIKQDIFAGFLVGTVEVELDDSLIGTGLFDTAFDDGLTLLSMEILGATFSPEDLDFAFFEAVIDTDFLEFGLELLFFDVTESGFADNWTYNLAYDFYDPFFNFLDIFSSFGDIVFTSADITLGVPELTFTPVEEVSAPASIALFSLVLGAMLVRRKIR